MNIPVEVKEPIEILSYPTSFSLYAGETSFFNVTVENKASLNYTVLLDFILSNSTYQTSFVTFSNQIYTVLVGEQNLTAWLTVKPDAPPISTSLAISFQRGVYPSGLVGYWKFDEMSGNIVYDSSGYGNNGLLIGNASRVDGIFGKGLLFGGGNYVVVPHSSSLDFEGVHPFTLEAWIRPDVAQGHSGSLAANVIDKYSNYGLVYDHGDPDARGVVFRSNESWYHSGEVNMSSGIWYLYVGMYDPPYLKVYLNGTEVTRREVGSLTLDSNTNNVVFGTNMELTSQFSGMIDNVAIYDRALTAEEIQALYTNPPAMKFISIINPFIRSAEEGP